MRRTPIDSAVKRALDRLRAAERERQNAIEELKELGLVRSRGLVGELGEFFAACYYEVEPERASNPGFDLIAKDGRMIQVKTLRSSPTNFRTSMGRMGDPYDVLFAIRLDEDYLPTNAIEVPRAVLERHYEPGARTTWTKALERAKGVDVIDREELLRCSGFAKA